MGPERLAAVRAELAGWFGETVHGWRHLRTYAIPEALPRFAAGQPGEQSLKLAEGLYRCGDYAAYPSYNASMLTGRHVAEQIAGR
jgi:predicted NAD/FAD-dependent oxidoreductase